MFLVNFRVRVRVSYRVRVYGLGLGIGFGIGNLKKYLIGGAGGTVDISVR